MKKLFTISLVLVCATMINAQNRVYFTPVEDWCAANAEFSAFLINTSTSNEELIHFTAVAGLTRVYVATLTNTNFDKIRFYRHPAGEILQNQNWGWNCTGQLPFNYVNDIYYIMNTSIWGDPNNPPAANDIQYFTVGTLKFLYFTPTYTGDNPWEQFNGGNRVQDFNVALINSTTSAVAFFFLSPVPAQPHVYCAALASTNYDKIRFYRVPPGETISDLSWGWNKTGEMPFNCYNWVMNTEVWDPGTNDIQYFTTSDCPQSSIETIFPTPQEIIRIEYYNLQGMRLQAEPQKGLFIAVPYYKGNVRGEAVKVLNRK